MEISARLYPAANTSESLSDSTISIDDDKPNLLSEKLRISTPPANRLPLKSILFLHPNYLDTLPESLMQAFEEEVRPYLLDNILVGIVAPADHSSVELQWRMPAEYDNFRVLTVTIEAERQTNKPRHGLVPQLSTWEFAAVQCRDLVNGHHAFKPFCDAANNYVFVHVEILATELRWPRYLGPADAYLGSYETWEPTIEGILASAGLAEEVQSMTMLRVGYDSNRDTNPLAILITLWSDCCCTKEWAKAEEAIVAYLQQSHAVYDVDVSIEWGG